MVRNDKLKSGMEWLSQCCLGLLLCFLSSHIFAQTQDIEFARSPLETGAEPSPNVLVIMDDSASMDWELAVQGSEGRFTAGGFLFGHVFGDVNNSYLNIHAIDSSDGLVVPTQEAADDFSNNYPGGYVYQGAFSNVWTLRSHVHNKLYYDPNVTYKPWPLEFDPPITPQSAPVDPSNPNSPRVNLTNATLSFYFPRPNSTDTEGPRDRPLTGGPGTPQQPDSSYTGSLMFYYLSNTQKVTIDPASDEAMNFTNWFTFYRRRELAAKSALSMVIRDAPDIRLGYATINSGEADITRSRRPVSPYNVNVPIDSNGTDRDTIIDAVYDTYAGRGGTHLRRALDRAGKYFSCAATGGIFGDGAACPRVDASVGGSCQRNLSLMMTDGYWEYDAPPLPASYNSNHDGGTATNFNGGAFADSVDETLADVAMYYFQNDLDGDATNNKVELTTLEKARIKASVQTPGFKMHQHMNTYTIAFGVQSAVSEPFLSMYSSEGKWLAPTDIYSPLAWPIPDVANTNDARRDVKKIEDLKHAAFNGRGDYYSALNFNSLVTSLNEVFRSTSQGAGVVAAPSFSTQGETANNVLYSGSYDAVNNSGDVKAYVINDDGTVNLNPIWSASAQLAVTNNFGTCESTDNRRMVTFDTDTYSGVTFNAANTASFLSAAQVDWLRGRNSVESSCVSGGLRERTNGSSLIGDIVNSKPLFVGAPNFYGRFGGAYPTGDTAGYSEYVSDNATRAPVVAVGTNGGMFHLFNALNGSEVMAYIPQDIIEPATYNNDVADLTSSSYSHEYFVDLSPAVNDVFIKPRGEATREWRSVAIGGYRAGGRGYFALDITDGISSANDAANAIMWEFNSDELSDAAKNKLGLSFSPPLLTMSNEANTPSTDGNKWVAVFANGYNSADGEAALFVLDIDAGYNGWADGEYTIIRALGSAATGTEEKNGLSTPRGIDYDGNGTIDYAYAGDLKGNLWRFDLTNPNAMSATKIFAARDGSANGGKAQPITTQPLVIRSPADPLDLIVVVTTGSWMKTEDALSTDVQSIYGIVDTPKEAPTSLPTRSVGLVARTLSNSIETFTDVVTDTDSDVIVRTISGAAFDAANDDGWYMDLVSTDSDAFATPDGERAIRNMTMRAGFAFVNTVYPSVDSCSANFGGAIMAFNPATGLLDKAMFDFNNDGLFDSGDLFAGMVSEGTTFSDSALFNNILFTHANIEGGGAQAKGIKTNTNPDVRTGRLSWRQIL